MTNFARDDDELYLFFTSLPSSVWLMLVDKTRIIFRNHTGKALHSRLLLGLRIRWRRRLLLSRRIG